MSLSGSSGDTGVSGREVPSVSRQRRNNDSTKPLSRLKLRRSWNLLRMKRRLEKEMDKNRTLPAPFVSIRVKDKRGSMQANLLLILAIMECICGFVLPISDAVALTDKWTQFGLNHKYYMETFLVSQYLGAIMALGYLQALIYYYGSYSGQIVDKEDGFPNINESPGDKFNQFSTSEDINSTKRHHYRSCLGCRKRYNRVAGKHYVSWHKEGMNLYMRLGAVGFGLGVMILDGFNLSSAWELGDPSCHSYLWIPKHSLRLAWVLWQTYFLFKYHRVLFRVHEFAVRTAYTHLAVVNLCHWLKVVVGEISESLKYGGDDVVSHLPTVRETYSTMVEHEHNYSSIVTILVDSTNSTLSNQTASFVRLGGADCRAHMGRILQPFLFPLAIEYSLVSGTLFYKLLHRVGEADTDPKYYIRPLSQQQNASMPSLRSPSTPSLMGLTPSSSILGSQMDENGHSLREKEECEKHTKYRQLFGCRVYLPVESEDLVDICEVKTGPDASVRSFPLFSSAQRSRDDGAYCHRSHNGLFLGLMVFIATSIGIIFFVSFRKPALLRYTPYIYQCTKIILLSISLLTCLLAIIQTYPMTFRQVKSAENFEYNLLGLGLLGCLTYHMLLFVPSLETVVHVSLYQSNQLSATELSDTRGTAQLYIIKCAVEIFQAAVQFFFIVETSRRGPCCKNQAQIKPGRSAIVFLLITNLALWLINTFEVRQMENQLALHRQYYGKRTWSVITCCFIPLIIFFRFHSTICLAQIWSTLYKWK